MAGAQIATIFCTSCDTLTLGGARCPGCGKQQHQQPNPSEHPDLAWRRSLPASLSSGVSYSNRTIYAVDVAGALHALDVATGEPSWDQPVQLGNWRIHERVAIGHGMVFVGPIDSSNIPAADKAVLALDASTGTERWRTPVKASKLSDPLVAEDSVYLATTDGYGLAFEATTGHLRWREPVHGVFPSSPGTGAGVVVFGGDEGVLTARAATDGHLLWRFQAENHGIWKASFPYSPVIRDGAVYATCWNRRCYAIDLETGQEIWESDLTEKRPPLAAPLVTDDRVIFCAHDRYVYCLDRNTGQRRWIQQFARPSNNTPLLMAGRLYVVTQDGKLRVMDPVSGKPDANTVFETGGKVETAWATDGQTIFVGDQSGTIYAVAVRTSEPISDPVGFEQRGQWAEAAALYAFGGDLLRAADIYRVEIGSALKAAQLYERGGYMEQAAEAYEAGGDLESARRLYQDLDRPGTVARLSEELEEPLAAAQAYEEAGNWVEAGRLYENLRQWPQAASSLERAGDVADQSEDMARAIAFWERAGDSYLRMEQPEKAAQLFKKAGADKKVEVVAASVQGTRVEIVVLRTIYGSEYVGRVLASRKRFVEAAREYESAGLPAAAAEMYELAGEYALAVERYLQAGNTAGAAQARAHEGNWTAAAELFIRAGQPEQAARAFASAENHLQAAELFRDLEQWNAAARQWEAAGDWKQAAHSWQRTEDWQNATRAWEKAGDPWETAECAAGAAEVLEEAGNVNDAAAYYEQAMQCYILCGADQRARYCDQRRRFLRKQPALEVSLSPEGDLVVGQSGKVTVTVKNVGWGTAHQVQVEAASRFESDPVAMVPKPFALRPDASKSHSLYVIPHHPGQLALDIVIAYSDQHGQTFPPHEQTADITVQDKEQGGGITPAQIHVHGDYYEKPRDVISGVKIERRSSSDRDRPEAREVASITCAHCNHQNQADASKCNVCQSPFIRCNSCGLSLPKPMKHCMHCGEPT